MESFLKISNSIVSLNQSMSIVPIVDVIKPPAYTYVVLAITKN